MRPRKLTPALLRRIDAFRDLDNEVVNSILSKAVGVTRERANTRTRS